LGVIRYNLVEGDSSLLVSEINTSIFLGLMVDIKRPATLNNLVFYKVMPKCPDLVKNKWTFFLSCFIHGHHFFKFFWAKIAQARITPYVVVEHFKENLI
jgi:hypothetical protein